MAKDSPKKSPKKAASGFSSHFWIDTRAVLFFTAALLLTLALFSYHPTDPGFLVSGTVTPYPQNLVGYVGSYLAGLLIQVFGLIGVWIPILLARLGVVTLLEQPLLRPGRVLVWVSVFASQCALLQWVLGDQTLSLYGEEASMHMGGGLGIVLGILLERVLGEGGTSVLLPIWVFLTLMFLWQLSPREAFKGLLAPARKAMDLFRLRRERRKNALEREEARTRVQQKQMERMERQKKRKKVKQEEPEAQTPGLPLDPPPSENGYRLPPLDLLDPPRTRPPMDEAALKERAEHIEDRLLEFDIEGKVVEIHPGPVVTVYEFRPAPGVKYNRVVGLVQDLALALGTDHVRMDRVGGKSHIGIEIPNEQREIISFRELLEADGYRATRGRLPIALGKTVGGEPYYTTLDRMPHLLVAGTTGSGKSVGINVLIHSILYRSTPEEVKFILIDPKQVELKVYENLPHLLTPVVTDVKKAANALNWAVVQMTERYKMLAACKVRNIEQFNEYLKQANAHTPNPQEQDLGTITLRPLPYIVIIIDELYDLMATMAKEVETAIARLSAMARAVGIHLILATQRPSRDVITGVIKSNLPTRIAFQVRERLESRLILDQNGAETLQGKGDMLFLPPGSGRLARVHGAFLSNVETQRVIQYLERISEPDFDEEVVQEKEPGDAGRAGEEGEEDLDPRYAEAVRLVVQTGVASASGLQRRLRVGYARAARLLDAMERKGIVGPADGAKPREILVDPSEIPDA